MQAKNGTLPIGRKGSAQNRKVIFLAVLVALIVVVIWTQFSSKPAPSIRPDAATLPGESSKPNVHQQKSFDPLTSADPDVPMAKLRQEAPVDEGGARNLFDFYTPPPPRPKPSEIAAAAAAPPPLPASVCGNRSCEPGENYINCPTDCPPPPPPALVVNLKYIGYLSEGGVPRACFTDGKEVFVGYLNDIIANKYRITKITDQSVELASLKGDQSKTIPFEGNNPG
jgi:hypothetical protein